MLRVAAESEGRSPRVMRQVELWLCVALIAAISALSYYNIDNLLSEREAVDRTQTILREIELLTSNLKDAETGQRGYVITGIESFLDPYRSAVVAIPAGIARLRALFVNSSEQLARLDEIARLERARIELLAAVIEARRSGGIAAVDTARLVLGKELMDRIRGVTAEMVAVETRTLNTRGEAAHRRAQYTLAALAFGTIVSIALIVFIFYRVHVEAGRRQRAERALKVLNQELEDRVAVRTRSLEREVGERREIEATLRALIDESPFAVVAFDAERRVTVWNEAAERTFGYTAAEALGRNYDEMVVGEAERVQRDEVWSSLPKGERMRGIATRRLHKSGKPIDVLVSGRALYGPDGAFKGAFGLIEDVTEKRSIERQLRQAQRMEAVGQLTGGIAHDFNNILSVVIGNIDLLIERLDEKGRERVLADSALKGALRGAELVQRLLAFARRQPLAPKSIDLNERLPALTALLHRALGEQIAIKTVPGGELWPAVADPAQIEDAILNLAINARDAMPGGGTLTIETANARLDEAYAATNPEAAPGEYVMLAVTDTGTGMPAAILDRAFEPFFTTKETGKGTGLGLSMVYGFVKQSNGHVKIYSEVGHGTSVKIYLPRASAPAPAEAEANGAAAGLPRGSERVLLVEDNDGVREAATRMLVELGYRVYAVANGPEALAWLDRNEALDLLFTDIVMPHAMNGRELAAEAATRRPGLKILFTTGYAEAAMQNGGLGRESLVIGKPYRKTELAHMLRRALDGDGNGNRDGAVKAEAK